MGTTNSPHGKREEKSSTSGLACVEMGLQSRSRENDWRGWQCITFFQVFVGLCELTAMHSEISGQWRIVYNTKATLTTEIERNKTEIKRLVLFQIGLYFRRHCFISVLFRRFVHVNKMLKQIESRQFYLQSSSVNRKLLSTRRRKT